MLQHTHHVLLPEIDKRIQIPAVLLEPADVDRSQGTGGADAKFIGAETDGGAVFLVGSVDGAGAGCVVAAVGGDPEGGEGGGEVGVWDF